MNYYLRAYSITAVVAYNDFIATGVLAALEENNISVPAQMSLVGFDNGLISRYLYPKLTTINYPIGLMAKQATLLSICLAEKGQCELENNMFSPTLVKRLSVSQNPET
ncbi:substrate-binding domain-containing protein [Psychromonas sp. KJ10-10]|uniref:substrate-binding domain-containing protein n=1 Tax=Psychromonas sp. KJ10-10 TaxID=3391823 RepID=UPI0039B513A6